RFRRLDRRGVPPPNLAVAIAGSIRPVLRIVVHVTLPPEAAGWRAGSFPFAFQGRPGPSPHFGQAGPPSPDPSVGEGASVQGVSTVGSAGSACRISRFFEACGFAAPRRGSGG